MCKFTYNLHVPNGSYAQPTRKLRLLIIYKTVEHLLMHARGAIWDMQIVCEFTHADSADPTRNTIVSTKTPQMAK